MKLPFKLKSNPQAFKASLIIVLAAFILKFIFLQLFSTNTDLENESLLISILYFLIFLIIVRITIEFYTRNQINIGVSKLLRQRKSEINILKDQENYRREFLGNISHELKTPLFTIQGYILTLIEGAMKDKKVREKYLKRAAKGVDRLISIVKDLDLITQFESGIKTVDKTDFNIYELVENVFELMEFESEKNNIKLQYENDNSTPIYVYADQERILQVLTNLVVNSIKYGSNNGYTKVVIEDLNKEKVIIKVIDDGEGIEKKHLPRLFERFYRIDKNRSRKKGGSGLGLSIVKHIIEAHNEQIFVKSEIGEGTEFSFTLSKPEFKNNFL
jgi:two-component system phosphate regulon sensor histidine kinase PhoR